MNRRNWTEEEATLALCLYYALPTSKHDKATKEVQELASLLDRSVGSVVFKLGNLKALDSSTEGIGFTHGANVDRVVWNRYLKNPALLFEDRDRILASCFAEETGEQKPLYDLNEAEEIKLEKELDFSEEDRTKLQKWRANQWAFRLSLLKGYDEHCCISGVSNRDFLVASHIVPWSVDKENRLNPQNGLLLNVFLDKAFDKGYITIRSSDFTVCVCDKITDPELQKRLNPLQDLKMHLPANAERYPGKEFLEYHNDVIFRR